MAIYKPIQTQRPGASVAAGSYGLGLIPLHSHAIGTGAAGTEIGAIWDVNIAET